MTVAEYASKFSTLLKYAPHVAGNPKAKYNRFVNGLHPAIYTFVTSGLPTSYAEAVERAKAAEAGLRRGGPQFFPPPPVSAQQPTLRPKGKKFKKTGSTASSSSSSSGGFQRESPSMAHYCSYCGGKHTIEQCRVCLVLVIIVGRKAIFHVYARTEVCLLPSPSQDFEVALV